MAAGELAGAQFRVAKCLLLLPWDSQINADADRLTRRTAGCGPACPVVFLWADWPTNRDENLCTMNPGAGGGKGRSHTG